MTWRRSLQALLAALYVFACFVVLQGCSKGDDGAPPDRTGTGGGSNGTGGSGIQLRDGGSDAAADGCVTADGGVCRYQVADAGPSCGDGIVTADIGEVCDDGNALAGDGCAGTCKLVEPNFMCPAGGGPCVATVGCGVPDATGVAKRDPGEDCDDGNRTDGDGCSAACKMEPGWFCSLTTGICQRNQNCGDGKVQSGEECDFGATPVQGCNAALCVYEPGWVCGATSCQEVQECGDGRVTGSEQCDDGNEVSGDGCSGSNCRIEGTWYSCPPTGGACTDNAACGNGVLETLAVAGTLDRKVELCDDGNTTPGDGCGAACDVEPGFQCRMAGERCVPACGDGGIIGTETCDDGNAVSGDGCSSTCLIEPGYACTGAPSACVASVCGNGVVEAGEACDKGDANGLFYGDGAGCSKTCTVEPTCRTGGVTGACTTACGDGNVDSGEGCDDGNRVNGDGCSDACQDEAGFTCTDVERPDTQPCEDPANAGQECLILPVTYRDFEGRQVTGGHPDFFYLGAGTGTARTICVPNAAGTPAAVTGDCSSTDATGPCTGLVGPTLNAQGKPEFARGTCPCRFTDWDARDIVSSATSGADECVVTGDGSTRWRVGYDTPLTMTVIQSAASFAQWYAGDYAPPVLGRLELAPIGAGQYQFSSSGGRTVNDDIHDICLSEPAGQARSGTLEAGFFPLDDQPGQKVCNIWPYWTTGLSTNCCAGPGCPVGSQWDPLAAYGNCPTEGEGGPVPSGEGEVTGMLRNFFFTTEVRYLFRYTTPGTLAFFGDDDVWVFVNGQLAVDLGATHERLEGSVVINQTFGLEAGSIYEIAVFHADRHPRESNYQLTLSGFSTIRSDCTPFCGDGVTTAGEECDNAAENNDTTYGGCTTECKFGPFCGDGQVDTPNEQCDDGRNVTSSGLTGCAPGCKNPPACGNGVLDAGEECDAGAANSDTAYGEGTCTTVCTLGPYCGDGRTTPPDEQCDNRLNEGSEYNQCAAGCQFGPRCGDGVVQSEFEMCDDGDALNGQPGQCNATCGAEGFCGDGVIDPNTEECDRGTSGNTGEYGGCTTNCVFAPYCGDGVAQTDQGEECDYGTCTASPCPADRNQPLDSALYGSCLQSCRLGPHCGDGTEQAPDEQCDDGNNESQDGCSGTCLDEIAIF